MLLPCPHCKRRFKLSPDRIPSGAAKLRCPACKGYFVVDTSPIRRVPDPAPEPVVRKPAPYSTHGKTSPPPSSSSENPRKSPSRNHRAPVPIWVLIPASGLVVALIGFLAPAAWKTPKTSTVPSAQGGPSASCALPSPDFYHAKEGASEVKSARKNQQDEPGLARDRHPPTYRAMWPFSSAGKQ